jgi:hypothetical protein
MDPDLEGPKTCGSGFGSGSGTLIVTIHVFYIVPIETESNAILIFLPAQLRMVLFCARPIVKPTNLEANCLKNVQNRGNPRSGGHKSVKF